MGAILYVSKEEALARLVSALVQGTPKKISDQVRARIKWIEEKIPDGYRVNSALVAIALKEYYEPPTYE